MPADRLNLKPGVVPANAERVLRELIQRAGEVQHPHLEPLRVRYTNWVELCEAQLAGLTYDAAILTMLQTARYWQIGGLVFTGHPAAMHDQTRGQPLIRAEVQYQTARMERLLRDLERRIARA